MKKKMPTMIESLKEELKDSMDTVAFQVKHQNEVMNDLVLAKAGVRQRLPRLRKLQYMLENHDTIFPRVGFNMGSWLSTCTTDQRTGNFCQTAACALGSAALYQPFKSKGLHIENNSVVFGSKFDSEAGALFFGIDGETADKLFMPHNYPAACKTKPKHVARKVAALIKKLEKEAA